MTSYLSSAFFNRLEKLSLVMRPELRGFFGGRHLVKSYGQTVEFADFRSYQLGDDIRRIDWNLYARFKKHFLKLFTDERQMHVQIFIDCSASMGVYPEKADYCKGIAAAFGFLAVHNMDKVSFHLLRGNKSEDPFGLIVGKNSFFKLISGLNKVKFDGSVDFASAIAATPGIGSNDGISIIISDFFSDEGYQKAVDYLLYKKRQVLLVQVLSKEDVDPKYLGKLGLVDAEATDASDSRNIKLKISRSMLEYYAEALNEIKDEIRTYCNNRGVKFVSADTRSTIEEIIFKQMLSLDIVK